MINKISPHVYWTPPNHDTDRPIMGAVCGKRGVLVIEGGNSEAHARQFLQGMAEARLAGPILGVAITHWHWDHVFGAGVFGAPIFASEATRRLVAWMAGLDWSDEALDRRVEEGLEIDFCRVNLKRELPDRTGLKITPPNVSFEGPATIDLGGVTVRLVPVGGDHASDSTVVFIPEDKILFTGDCLYPDLHHGPDRYTTARLFPLIDTILSFDAEIFFGSHQDKPISRADMVRDLALHKTIGRAAESTGFNRQAALSILEDEIARWGREDIEEIVAAFIAGEK